MQLDFKNCGYDAQGYFTCNIEHFAQQKQKGGKKEEASNEN